jgi:predicted nucleotidyltransferase
MSKYEKIVQRIVSMANRTVPDAEVYLYGSRARGTAHKLSDWDVLVLLNSANISFEFETSLMNEFFELELETGEIISPMIYSRQEWNEKYSITPLFENIQKEGIRIK